MRNLLIPFLFLFSFPLKLLGQDNSNPANLFKINEVLPPAPNAAALGKYGGTDVNLSSGALGKSIPIYNYQFREMMVPISISYSTSGFKVDELPSRAGYGWALNAGGVINRSLYGDADETHPRSKPPSSFNADDSSLNFLENVADPGFEDAQVDIYSFNFCGYNGKFIFDENGSIVQMPVSSFIIEDDFSQTAGWNFKITTPDGTKYYFGGSAATEKTRKENSCGKPNDEYIATSWYLLKIESQLGEVINFVYQALASFQFNAGINQILYYNDMLNGSLNCLTQNSFPSSTCPVYPNSLCYNILRTQGVYLSEINSNAGGKISFDYINQFGGDKLLSTITVKDYNNTVFRYFKFSYTKDTATAFQSSLGGSTIRPFLDILTDSSANDQQIRRYRFSYNSLGSLPFQLTFAQDHWGYFNGASNLELPPEPEDANIKIHIPQAKANREPNAVYARKGLLSKIIYPTGGWDTIYYENNTYWGTKTIYPNASVVTQTVTGTGLMTQQQSQSGNLGVTYAQYGLLTYTIFKNSTDAIDSLHNKGTVTISENGVASYTNVLVPDGIERSEYIYMQPGKTYVITVKANGTIVTTKASLNYHAGNITYPTGNYVCGGLRVAKTESYTTAGASPVIRRFYYYKLSNPDSSTGRTPPSTKYGKYFIVRNLCDGNGGAPSTHYCQYLAVYSSSLNSLDNYPGGIAYSTVIEGFGNNFENGAIEHNFKLYENFPASLYSPYGDYLDNAPRGNMGDYGGKETSQIVYKNGFVPVKKVVNTYKDDSRRSKLISSYHCNKKYAYLILPSRNDYNIWAESYDAVIRFLISKWIYADTTREIVYNTSGDDSITTLTMYYYDNDAHLQLTKTKTLDSKGDTIITAIRYPQDFANLTATDAVTAGIKTLQARNMIKPVELSVFNKKKGSSGYNLVHSQMISYYQANALPSTVSKVEVASPAANFLPMLAFLGAIKSDSKYVKQVYLDSYDNYGNLLQQHKANDVNHSYIWSYKNQYPIAEAVNAKSNEIYFNSFEEATGEWCGSMQTKSDRAHSGSLSGFMDNPGSQEVYCYSGKRLSLSLSATKKFHYSGWVYSDGPEAEIFLMMTTVAGGAYTSYSNIVSSLSNAGKWVLLEKDVDVPANVKEIWLRVDNNSIGKIWCDDLRIYPSDAQMTTFTYQPLLGMTSKADISNRITYYTYDGLARLSSIKDQDGNILKKYCYGYDGQSIACGGYFGNAARSQAFSRNNCGTGYIGSVVIYTVPANKYFSALNQADADLKAQNDITVNGQSYANANGTCAATSSQITITASNYISVSGFTATFTNTSTLVQTIFNIPASGGVLGTLNSGTYNVTIAKSGNIMQLTFSVCTNVKEAATSATFNNIAISSNCNTITLDAL